MASTRSRCRRWLSHEDAVLDRRIAKGGTRKQISNDVAKELGRSAKAVENRMYSEGLSANPARRVPAGNAPKHREFENAVPLCLGEGDGIYVNTCLSHGGFASCAQTNDGRFVFGHAGKAWAQP